MSKLDELVKQINKKRVFVQMHNYPDQDAIASARGLQVLLAASGIQATICYTGQIDKFNTIKMLELLHITITPISMIPMSYEDEIILVDSQKGNINVEDLVGKEIACIDHHPMQATDCYRFFDIRGEVGACSSIIASYFIENNIEMDEETATALLYGIKIDTANLMRKATTLDVDMFYYLFKKANIDMLRKFENCSLMLSDLRAYQQAISNLKIYDYVAVADIGKDCSEAIIGTVSDFLLALSEIKVTLTYSIRAGGIKFSIRCEEEDLDASEIIKQALKGYGDGGGHASMAAGFVPDVDLDNASSIIRFVENQVVEQVVEGKRKK